LLHLVFPNWMKKQGLFVNHVLRLDENRNTDDVQHRHNDKRNTDTDTEKITMLMIFRLDTLKLLMTEQTMCGVSHCIYIRFKSTRF
jgi:hypothetical protein